MKLIVRALFSLILPVTITIIIPVLVILGFNNHLLAFNSALSGAMLAIGTFLIVLGLGFVIYTNHAFFRIGKGTLAPWDPPKKLVVAGLYRYVRNPMISGVLMIVLGESLIFASIDLLILFILFFIVNHVYFVYLEEPGLVKRFGNDYILYRKNVPRWIPRLKPWKIGEAVTKE
ncbi:MAG TPA: isoprenylcysteine carboxylmethyltransferase family protein [Methanobacterium sp.]|nr:isoprenylcysteine carboxylmethyltransferase family protein [Methanobacterium sp.]